TDGMVDVFLGGNALVRGIDASTIHLDQTGATAKLKWDIDNSDVDASSGKDGALLTAANVTLPGYLSKLDAVATQFVNVVNTQHAAGVDLNSAPSNTPSGRNLLTGTGSADINIDPSLTPQDVAAAAVGAGKVDGSNALL